MLILLASARVASVLRCKHIPLLTVSQLLFQFLRLGIHYRICTTFVQINNSSSASAINSASAPKRLIRNLLLLTPISLSVLIVNKVVVVVILIRSQRLYSRPISDAQLSRKFSRNAAFPRRHLDTASSSYSSST